MPVPVLVRNLEKGPSVFTDAETKQAIEWGAYGDPKGEDVQYVPEDLLTRPAFLKAIDKGIYEVVEASDDVKALLERQAAAWRHRQDVIDSQAAATIDPATDRELANVTISEKGQITSVPTMTGELREGANQRAEQVEGSIPVIIDPATSPRRPA